MFNYNNTNILKLGAIDIGSNSIRLLITNVIPTPSHTYYQKVSMIRLPIRLGADAFSSGKISESNAKRMIKGMRAYKLLMDIHGVEDYRACATSAMRESKNGKSLVNKILKKTGVNIELIDGKEEAKLIFESKLFDKIHPEESSFIYIDVGGGSTELTLFREGEITASKSFKIGTVRLLNEMVSPAEWQEMSEWIKKNTSEFENLAAIGSGGNINKTFKLSGKLQGEPLSLKYLITFKNRLEKMTKQELITVQGLNLDRADVIIPALRIFVFTMHNALAKKVYVPKIGVSDGITRDLYHRKYREEMEKVIT